MQSRSVRRVDPNDWAAKKKAAVEKAKQLREARAQAVDENHTFQPTINKRPQYLDKGGAMSDSLDEITGGQRPVPLSDDIFERPLPGSKPSVPSPNSDALGHEMRRQHSNRSDNAGPYKSKFMQQFEQQQAPVVQQQEEPGSSHNRAAVEADDTFMNMLRGSDTKKSTSGPGWNTDITPGGFGDPPPVRSRAPRRQPSNPTAQAASQQSSRPKPDWNMDTEIPQRSMTSPRGDVPKPDVSHARSRLALLKSKMNRRSDSSDLRSTSAGDAAYATSQSFRVEPQPSAMPDHRKRTASSHVELGSQMSRLEEQQLMAQKSDKVKMSPRYEPSSDPPRRAAPVKKEAPGPSRQVRRPDPYEAAEEPYDPPARTRPAPQPPQQPAYSRPPAATAFTIGGDDDTEEAPAGEQLECPDCGRKFNPIPYEKHVKICAKVFQQKRKAFDSAKMRIEAIPELVEIKSKEKRVGSKKKPMAKQAPAGDDRPINGTKQAKWKEQSEAFRAAMKAARQYSDAVKTGAPLPPPPVASAPDPSLILCENCGRRFNEKAAERHIPQCKNIKAKPKVLLRGSGGGGGMNGASTATAQASVSNPNRKPSALPKASKKR